MSGPFVAGYALLRPQAGYQGVDRDRFAPEPPDEAPAGWSYPEDVPSGLCWPSWPPGWKQDAYRMFEENLAPGCFFGLDLIASREVAEELARFIAPHAKEFEVVLCECWDGDERPPGCDGLIGFDVALKGGDYFSPLEGKELFADSGAAQDFLKEWVAREREPRDLYGLWRLSA